MLPVFLQLDSQLKPALETLFVVSAQVPAIQMGNLSLNEDAAAVFRIAKEFSLTHDLSETRAVHIEDVARLLRFICWMLATPNENADRLKPLLAAIAMQMQSQDPAFESLLKAYGIDRQLDNQLPKQAPQRTSVSAQHTDRIHETRIRVTREGADLQTTTRESIWKASRRK